jgi:serine/threonine-protein kinase
MGRVMRVRHSALGKQFALKLIKARSRRTEDPRAVLSRGATRVALTHDNICSIVDFGQDETFGLFMVMELLDGQTVHQKLKGSGKLTPKVACDVMWQLADAVRFIHSRTILHGDIKTENIFMVRTSAQRRRSSCSTSAGARRSRADRGHRRHARVHRARAHRSSTGVAGERHLRDGDRVLELLTGKLPFTGDMKEVFRQQRDAGAGAVEVAEDPLDERADEIIARATAKDPAKRHPDVAALMYELRALMGMLGMEQGGARRRALAPDAARERREHDHRPGRRPRCSRGAAADGVVRLGGQGARREPGVPRFLAGRRCGPRRATRRFPRSTRRCSRICCSRHRSAVR